MDIKDKPRSLPYCPKCGWQFPTPCIAPMVHERMRYRCFRCFRDLIIETDSGVFCWREHEGEPNCNIEAPPMDKLSHGEQK